MRIYKALLVASVPALALAAPAHAQVGGGQMNGVVQPVCQVNDLFASISFPSMTAGTSISDGVQLRCNDADGAEITMTSSEGGLESDDFEDLEIEYRAELSSGAISGGSVVLDLPFVNGDNDTSATGTAPGSLALAGGVAASLEVALKETAVWAGGYSDTLTVQLTAS